MLLAGLQTPRTHGRLASDRDLVPERPQVVSIRGALHLFLGGLPGQSGGTRFVWNSYRAGTSIRMQHRLDELLELENAGWRSLCDGTGSTFYGQIMTADGQMVLANGATMSRDQVVDSLSDAPPWDSYEIADPMLVPLGSDAGALVYRGIGHRSGGDSFTGMMTSTYVRTGSSWKLAVYQQTPVA